MEDNEEICNKQELERKLHGRTLQVYIYLLKKKAPSGIREIQRDLGLSSPSVAEYQIEKLVDLSLVSRDPYGRCFVKRKVKVKALDSYINFGRFTIPRLSFYASVFSAISIFYMILSADTWTVYGLLVPTAAASVLWFEAWKMWKHGVLYRAAATGTRNEVGERATTDDKSNDRSMQVLLISVATALAVFVSGYFFLFNYMEPNQLTISNGMPPVGAPNEGFFAGNKALPSQPSLDESLKISREKVEDSMASNSALIEANSLSSLATTVMVFAGALAVGFIAFIMVKYRCSIPEYNNNNNNRQNGVLMLERHQDSEF